MRDFAAVSCRPGFTGRVQPVTLRWLIDVDDATVIVRMMGGCQGCGMADVTLRQGIESSLKRVLPSLKGIKDITDHASASRIVKLPVEPEIHSPLELLVSIGKLHASG